MMARTHILADEGVAGVHSLLLGALAADAPSGQLPLPSRGRATGLGRAHVRRRGVERAPELDWNAAVEAAGADRRAPVRTRARCGCSTSSRRAKRAGASRCTGRAPPRARRVGGRARAGALRAALLDD